MTQVYELMQEHMDNRFESVVQRLSALEQRLVQIEDKAQLGGTALDGTALGGTLGS